MNLILHSSEALSNNVRQFSKAEVSIWKQHVLGQGVFAKCFLSTVGPNRACVKIFRTIGEQYFFSEANLLSLFCHPNILIFFAWCMSTRKIQNVGY